VLVAEVDGKVAGTLLATSDGRRGWLQRLVVAPPARGQGLGRRLVAEAERRLAARGVPQINLLVVEGNDVASAFWTRLGYEPGIPLDFWKKRLG
jgi:ribosomal protein S18 acetylase RimI-like enzyme